MTTGNEDYARHSPDKLLNVFSKGRLVFWCVVAIGVHAVILLGTSTGYVRDRWIDPEGAIARKEAAEAALKAGKGGIPATSATGTVATAAAATTNGATAAASESGTNATMTIDGEVVPADRTNAAVIKRITEAAKPEEIPEKPDELGITLEDTSVR
ncbi:MAG: hypothetical protein FJ225_00360 [Lentisphaerae bacterium]|nr:hypothetical protein [Lentisphaerota bacterium]